MESYHVTSDSKWYHIIPVCESIFFFFVSFLFFQEGACTVLTDAKKEHVTHIGRRCRANSPLVLVEKKSNHLILSVGYVVSIGYFSRFGAHHFSDVCAREVHSSVRPFSIGYHEFLSFCASVFDCKVYFLNLFFLFNWCRSNPPKYTTK